MHFDLVAIAEQVGPVEVQKTKDGSDLDFWNVVLRDETFKITMKVWADHIQLFNRTEG